MNKNIILSITVCAIIILGAFYLLGSNGDNTQANDNVKIKDGVQYVQIKVGGGYSPKVSTGKADIPTKLVFDTGEAFDCSTSVVVRQLNFSKILNPNSQETVDAGTLKSGDKISGTCSMGMYSFVINFN